MSPVVQKVVRTGNSSWEITRTETIQVSSVEELLSLTGVKYTDAREKAPTGLTTQVLNPEMTAKGTLFLAAVKEAGQEGILVSKIAEKFEVSDARKLRGHILAAKELAGAALTWSQTEEGTLYKLSA